MIYESKQLGFVFTFFFPPSSSSSSIYSLMLGFICTSIWIPGPGYLIVDCRMGRIGLYDPIISVTVWEKIIKSKENKLIKLVVQMVMKLSLLTARKVWRGFRGSESSTALGKLITAPTRLLEEALLVLMILLFFNSLQLMWPCWLVLMQLEYCTSVSALMHLLVSFV